MKNIKAKSGDGFYLLNQLESEVLRKARAVRKFKENVSLYGHPDESGRGSIAGAFSWRMTREGVDFRHNIYAKTAQTEV